MGLGSVGRLLKNGPCDNVSVVLLGFCKGSQYSAEKVGASSQTLSLFGCWCLEAYSLVAGLSVKRSSWPVSGNTKLHRLHRCYKSSLHVCHFILCRMRRHATS